MTPPATHARTPHASSPEPAEEAGILLVDDREDNLIALEAVLDPLEVPLVRAMSGEEAMKALLRQEFAVILLDVLMPGMDGFETAAHIKRLDQTRDVPIIFLTGAESAGEAGYAFRGYATGAADYLTKPFDPWMLRSKVSVFLELHRKNRQLQTLLADEHDRLGEFARRLEALERYLNPGGAAGPVPADATAAPAATAVSTASGTPAVPDVPVPELARHIAELARALDELRAEMP